MGTGECIFVFIVVAVSSLIISIWHRHVKARHAEQIKNEELKREVTKKTVGRIAHELGTPIVEISVSLYALHEKLPGKFAHYLRAIENAVERVQAIMQAMREIQILEDLIKSDLDINSSIELKVVSVNQLVQMAVMAVKETRRDGNVKFSIQYSSDVTIKCNPNEIIQTFINLLRNSYDAILANKERVKRGIISVKSTNVEDIVQVIIHDNGEGISEDIEGKTFDKGFSTRSGAGRGFGLSVAKNLVGKNDGKLEVKNDIIDGKIYGCIAIVEFPKAFKVTDISE